MQCPQPPFLQLPQCVRPGAPRHAVMGRLPCGKIHGPAPVFVASPLQEAPGDGTGRRMLGAAEFIYPYHRDDEEPRCPGPRLGLSAPSLRPRLLLVVLRVERRPRIKILVVVMRHAANLPGPAL